MLVEKYRPQTINDLIGQDEIRDSLLDLITYPNDLPNMLFYGLQGTGKTTTGLSLIHDVLGDNSVGNYIELNGSDERGIDIMRKKVLAFCRNSSLNGSRIKFILIDEADLLTNEAQSLLRRPLEIYSSRIKFIFTLNEIAKMIRPLQSRCLCYEFKKIPVSKISFRLLEIAQIEGLNCDHDLFNEIAKESEGDLRTAIQELEKEKAFLRNNKEYSL